MNLRKWLRQAEKEKAERYLKFLEAMEEEWKNPGKVGDVIKIRLPERYR